MLTVERHSFFRGPGGGTLRFTEHAPHVEEHDHPVCNCTKNVAKRPKGTPRQVTQEITYSRAPIGELRPEFQLCDGRLTFYWGMPPTHTETGHIMGDYNHAYFGWTRVGHHGMSNRGQRSVSVQITLPGYGLIGCFFANLYLGNRIDVSTLMNGWLPSRIVDLSKLNENDLWLHDCSFGGEAMRVFSDSEEASMWRHVILDVERIERCMQPRREELSISVEGLREQVEKDIELIALVDSVIETLAPIVTSIQNRNTELFHLSDEVRCAIYPSRNTEAGSREESS